jgi:hypothetical protein
MRFNIDSLFNHRGRFAPSRDDIHERHYSRLEPSHRLALYEFRKSGLVLPFGAHTAHFNYPNRYQFWRSGEWPLCDFANPLKGWECVSSFFFDLKYLTLSFLSMEEVIKSGMPHGATREDIYGCLYFHVSDVLQKFTRRLSKFHISFKIFIRDMITLSDNIRNGELEKMGLPAATRFDRIDVSNAMDKEYVGVSGIIEKWGPLLRRSPTATLLGYFLNWRNEQADAIPCGDDRRETMDKLLLAESVK